MRSRVERKVRPDISNTTGSQNSAREALRSALVLLVPFVRFTICGSRPSEVYLWHDSRNSTQQDQQVSFPPSLSSASSKQTRLRVVCRTLSSTRFSARGFARARNSRLHPLLTKTGVGHLPRHTGSVLLITQHNNK